MVRSDSGSSGLSRRCPPGPIAAAAANTSGPVPGTALLKAICGKSAGPRRKRNED
jgi:hypothetical protein